MGLDIYLSSPGVPKGEYGTEDVNADIDPDHLFKKNYLRSSYNGGGYNSVVGNLLEGRDLYSVFAPCKADLNKYTLRPTKAQLRESRALAVQMAADLDAVENVTAEFYSSVPARPQDGIVRSDEDAIAKYREQAALDAERAKAANPFGGGWYSNSVGFWFLGNESLKVRGLIPGTGFMGAGVYLVAETDLTWYRTAARIVVEFIDYALTQNRPTMKWSG